MAAFSFNAPIAATCLNLLLKRHVVEIRVVNFEGFGHGQLLAGWVVDGSIIHHKVPQSHTSLWDKP
jgi:hypothetical protein